MRNGNRTATREDGSSATIRKLAAGKSDTETIAASSAVERMEAKHGRGCESDDGVITTTPWMKVFDPEQAEQELEEELRDVDNPWVVSGSLASMTAQWQVAATAVDTSGPAPVDASTVAAAHAVTSFVNAAIQPREMNASAATTAPQQLAATTVDASAPPLLEVPTVLMRMRRRLSSPRRFCCARWTFLPP